MSVRTIQKNDDIIIRLCEVLSVEDDNASIDCSDLPRNGVYILTLKGNSTQENYKFIN